MKVNEIITNPFGCNRYDSPNISQSILSKVICNLCDQFSFVNDNLLTVRWIDMHQRNILNLIGTIWISITYYLEKYIWNILNNFFAQCKILLPHSHWKSAVKWIRPFKVASKVNNQAPRPKRYFIQKLSSFCCLWVWLLLLELPSKRGFLWQNMHFVLICFFWCYLYKRGKIH